MLWGVECSSEGGVRTDVLGTVSSWVLRMEVSQYVFISAYNVVVSCLLFVVICINKCIYCRYISNCV